MTSPIHGLSTDVSALSRSPACRGVAPTPFAPATTTSAKLCLAKLQSVAERVAFLCSESAKGDTQVRVGAEIVFRLSAYMMATARRRSRRVGIPITRMLPLGRFGQGLLCEVAATTRRGGIDDADLPIAGSKRLSDRALDSLRPCVWQEFLCRGRGGSGPRDSKRCKLS